MTNPDPDRWMNDGDQHGLVDMGVPPPVSFDQLPIEVQAEAIANDDVAPLDYDG